MVFTCRDGGTCSQMIIGLSANQTVQLFDWMGAHVDTCRSAIAEGNGGVQFSEVRGNHEHLRVGPESSLRIAKLSQHHAD